MAMRFGSGLLLVVVFLKPYCREKASASLLADLSTF
jgi:hypothetical protein